MGKHANSGKNGTVKLQDQNLGMWKLGHFDHCGYKNGPRGEHRQTVETAFLPFCQELPELDTLHLSHGSRYHVHTVIDKQKL